MIDAWRLLWCVLVISYSIMVTSCHKAVNPLRTMTRQQAGSALAKASWFTERALRRPGDGYDFGDCMQGKKSKLYCDTLYAGMVTQLHQVKVLSDLSIAQLRDGDAFKWYMAAYFKSAYELA